MVSLTNTSAVLLDALAHLEAEGKTLETRLYDLRAFVLRITYMRSTIRFSECLTSMLF